MTKIQKNKGIIIFSAIIFCGLFVLSQPAEAARLFTSGFEMNSLTSGVEFTATYLGENTVQSATKRSGAYALKYLANNQDSYTYATTPSLTGSNTYYWRMYFRLHTSLSSDAAVLTVIEDSSWTYWIGLKLTTADKLQFIDRTGVGQVQIGSDSAALVKDTWYRLEMSYNNSTKAISARIDGTEFASGTANSVQNMNNLFVGAPNLTVTTGEYYNDDIAMNDSTGSFQNSWPGRGNVIMMKPDSAGDINSFEKSGGGAGSSTNYQDVDETTPDDGTTYLRSTTLNQEDMYNCGASGLAATDSVSVVQLGIRANQSAATSPTIKGQIKKTSGGTTSQGTAWTPDSTTWRTNANAAPFTANLTLYQDPDNVNWTSSTLDSMQIGFKETTDNSAYVQVSTVWATVEYVPQANIFYSVGQNATDHSSGGNVSIASGVATFTVAQVATNLGVGDRLTAGGNVYYLSTKTSTTVWNVVTALGAVPADLGSTAVTSIAHEYTTLSAAEAGAGDANHLNTTDLVSGNYVLNLPCYYDTGADTTAVTINGWTTGASNYIKIYTPNNTSTEANQSQRHAGKWDDGKYRLVNSVAYWSVITVTEQYVRIDGIQIENQSNKSYHICGIQVNASATTDSAIRISNNIMRATGTGTASVITAGLSVDTAVSFYAWNNIIYDWGTGIAGPYSDVANIMIVYSNTCMDNSVYGISMNPQIEVTLRWFNNLVQGTATNYNGGVFLDASGNNLSEDTTSPDSAYRNKIVIFTDEAGDDFHLAVTDTGAKNAGVDLSADANLAFSTDIDNQTRSGTWDIGADEVANNVFYSVGQDTTTDRKVAGNVTITSGVATFENPQTGNIGVGDVLIAGGNTYYISGKQSTSVWNVVTKIGITPNNLAATSVTSIKRAFSSLNSAYSGVAGASYLNTTNLVTGNYIINLPCYYDTGPDTTVVNANTYTTGPNHYVKIYTPNNIANEANVSQRHSGAWNDTKYQLTGAPSASGYLLQLYDGFIIVDGLQLSTTNNVNHDLILLSGGYLNEGMQGITISNNIMKNTFGNPTADIMGIRAPSLLQSGAINIFNNIIYDLGKIGNTTSAGIYWRDVDSSPYVYNNTIDNVNVGFWNYSTGVMRLKNNITQNCTDGYYQNAHNSSDYNISDIAGDTTGYSPSYRSGLATTVSFVNAGGFDFHLDATDTGAKNLGADLSADANLAFSIDIDGQSRLRWDIGADETANLIIEIKRNVNFGRGVNFNAIR